jgi:mannose/fructose/N-acetylgalactosamine-specific phosphotransferase system component IIB
MREWLHFVVDDRGRSRQLVEAWARAVGAEHLWFIDYETPQASIESTRPTECDLSHWELPALLLEPRPSDEPHVLCIFPSIVSLAQAIACGTVIDAVTVVHRHAGETRLASHVHLDGQGLAALQRVKAAGTRLLSQPLPNITARSLQVPAPDEQG